MSTGRETRVIDRWYPVAAVDESCRSAIGSGKVEKAIFPWFASRPIAQARAAALTALLPNDEALRPFIEAAIRTGDPVSVNTLSAKVQSNYSDAAPIVLDMFSGRGIIPLEAARSGAKSIGVDLSPVATFAGRLLADYIARDWTSEPPVAFGDDNPTGHGLFTANDRLVRDVETTLNEIGKRVAKRMEPFYPRNALGDFPWAYLWSITLPCDDCKRRFPLLGSLVLRYPYKKHSDLGQSLRLIAHDATWSVEIIDGPPSHEPTYSSAKKIDGKNKKGKTARCFFCGHVHSLEAVKAKGKAGEYQDELIAVVDTDKNGKRIFRLPSKQELKAIVSVPIDPIAVGSPYSAIPDEQIASGNVHTVMASGYGYKRFGDLMCPRQTLSFVTTVAAIREIANDLRTLGISTEYIKTLIGYAASTLCRRLRRATRGTRIQWFGNEAGTVNNNLAVKDVFSNEASINFQFDYLEAGPGNGPGTWASISENAVQSLLKIRRERFGRPSRFICSSATTLPIRDSSIDVVITDPPYYDMVEYADASDLYHVWLKRILFDFEPDLFGSAVQQADGLQDKNAEIIVRRVHEPNRVKHDRSFYESMLATSFQEARRVLRPDGYLVVMFGHSDPDAWRRLLGALQTAGFVVTSAWPSRTETANTGVASIKVTVTIGCRVAAPNRPLGIGSEVDREVVEAVIGRVAQWDQSGLALEDQLMASYGPAMEVYGRYIRVINPDGSNADLEYYLGLARRAVRDAMRLRVDELPLETFDAITRFAIFWLRAKGQSEVPKGEARFFAQADELHLDGLRDRILTESKAGFQIRLQDERPVGHASSIYEVVRAMAHSWDAGGMEAVAETIAAGGLQATNQHLWAVVSDLASHLPASDKVAKALAGIKRSSATISTLAANAQSVAEQGELFDTAEVQR